MPLGSSSAAPAINPGPSCFSRGNRTAGFTATETAASFSSFAIMAAVGRRRAPRRRGSVLRKPCRKLEGAGRFRLERLAQVLRQDVVGVALLELAQLALGFDRLAFGLELANIRQPFFRRALLGFRNRETVSDCSTGARALERRCRFADNVRARGWRGRLRRSDLLLGVEDALGVRHGRLWRDGAGAYVRG